MADPTLGVGCLAGRGLLSRCRPGLRWRARFPAILHAIEESAADIICLQEIDSDPCWLRGLESLGYDGRFKQRTGPTEASLSAEKRQTLALNHRRQPE